MSTISNVYSSKIGDSELNLYHDSRNYVILLKNDILPELNKEWIFGNTDIEIIVSIYWYKKVKSILTYHERHKDEPLPYICDDTTKIVNMANEAIKTCLI